MRIEYRWGAGDAERMRKHVAELVALAPDVILAWRPRPWRLCNRRPAPSRSYLCTSPIRSARLCRKPGAAGRQHHRIHTFEYSLSGKWLELLKEIAPGVTRAAVLRDPAESAGTGQWARNPGGGAVARVEVSPVAVRDAGEIERAVAASRASPNGGLIVTRSAGDRFIAI